MEGFWTGVLVGIIIVCGAVIIWQQVQIKAMKKVLAETNQADANETIEKNVANLTPDELGALVAKDLRGTGNDGNGSNPVSK